MAEELTLEQKLAVTDRGGKLLVSAAAGSGKTKVLVDRLLGYLTDPVMPANLDEFLIITYTKAAAAELRSKIAAKLTERIAEDPSNRHLHQQLQRLYLTKISTVHAFCTDILREYAYRLDISADFRVADENECAALQLRAMEQILNDAYANAGDDADFCAFVDSQGFGRDDRQIPEVLIKVYNSARCHLNPDAWLDRCVGIGDDSAITDAAQTVWGAYLVDDLHKYLDLQINAMDRCAQRAAVSDNMEKPAALMAATVDQLRALRSCNTWDAIRAHMDIDYGRLTISKKCTDQLLGEQIKAVRDACKKGLAKKLRRFSDDSARVLLDLEDSMHAARGLVALAKRFGEAYDKHKRSRNLLDFGDLEHKTLDLLLGKSRLGTTQVAYEIGQRFREVMVDEYQDSNQVQDAIFSALTQREQNCFMVGDVKQSIYQFRLADPGIFLEKYNQYLPAGEAKPGQGRKVLLSNNFRSSGSVIGAVNDVFSVCMSPQVGGLVYGEGEQLKEGVSHCQLNEKDIELYGINVCADTYAEEAAFVAERIATLLDGTHMVRQGNGLRPIVEDDIVILLRSPGSVGGAFRYALESRGIRCTTGTSFDLFQTEEIETLRAILQTISNPLQDIPLAAALTSRVFGFTADDMAYIRGGNRNCSMYASLKNSDLPKVNDFMAVLNRLRRISQMNTLTQLLSHVFAITRIDSIYASLPDGVQRTENLHSLCQFAADYEAGGSGSLRGFLDHLDSLEEKGLAAPGEQSSAGAVTVMSIHKSKGLEFPVVFLCGLSRVFNRDDLRAQVLCDKELGLGLSCVDTANRVRYPTVAKRAIAAKITADSLSEELRVLYVAMTRARDRLIMTYAGKSVQDTLDDISLRMELSDPLLLTSDVDCPGAWVLYAAQKHKTGGWSIPIVQAEMDTAAVCDEEGSEEILDRSQLEKLRQSLSFHYDHLSATSVPSKQTATQLKGREKDKEAAENTTHNQVSDRLWRKPSFIDVAHCGKAYGSATHAVLQYIRYDACDDLRGAEGEIQRLLDEKYISQEQAAMVNVDHIVQFFATDLGKKLRFAENVLREFKFSILDDAAKYCPDVDSEQILLQGVVDCALIEKDGITVVDFKTDRVTQQTVHSTAERYRPQIMAYADALARIYKMPIKAAKLYFFNIAEFVSII